MAVSKAEILDAIAGMTVLDLSELIKEMEVKFDVSAAAAADTPNLASISLINSDRSRTVMPAMASSISALLTAMITTPE